MHMFAYVRTAVAHDGWFGWWVDGLVGGWVRRLVRGWVFFAGGDAVILFGTEKYVFLRYTDRSWHTSQFGSSTTIFNKVKK